MIEILSKFYIKKCKKLGIFEHYFNKKGGILSKFYGQNVKNWVFLNIISIKKVEYYPNFM